MSKKERLHCKFVVMCPKIKAFCESQTGEICYWGTNPNIKMATGKVPNFDLECVCKNGGEGYYGRTRAKRIVTAKNNEWGLYMKQVSQLWDSLPIKVKQDFANYAKIIYFMDNSYKCKVSGRLLFFKVLSKQTEQFLSLEDISQFFGNSLNEWIKNGFLEDLPEPNFFFADIVAK